MTDGTGVTETEWTAWRTFTSMRRQLDVALERQLQRDGDISAAEYSVLITLFEAEGKQLRARDIGMVLAWEKSRVSHQISRMEKRGLVAVDRGDNAEHPLGGGAQRLELVGGHHVEEVAADGRRVLAHRTEHRTLPVGREGDPGSACVGVAFAAAD